MPRIKDLETQMRQLQELNKDLRSQNDDLKGQLDVAKLKIEDLQVLACMSTNFAYSESASLDDMIAERSSVGRQEIFLGKMHVFNYHIVLSHLSGPAMDTGKRKEDENCKVVLLSRNDAAHESEVESICHGLAEYTDHVHYQWTLSWLCNFMSRHFARKIDPEETDAVLKAVRASRGVTVLDYKETKGERS